MGWICKEWAVTEVAFADSEHSGGKRAGFLRRALLRNPTGTSLSSVDHPKALIGNQLLLSRPRASLGSEWRHG